MNWFDLTCEFILAGLPSRGRDVVVCIKDVILVSFPIPFYSFLVYRSVFMALSAVFRSFNSPDNSPLSHSVLPGMILIYWSFQLHISL